MFKRFSMIIFLAVAMIGCDMINPISPIIQLGVFWLEGEAHKYYNTDQDTMVRSVKTTLKDLEFSILEERTIDDYYWIKATDGSGSESHIKIKVREVKHNITKLSVRVNTFGDRPYVEMIYRHVDEEPGVKQFVTIEGLNTAYETRGRPARK
jgi:hypothetical protein